MITAFLSCIHSNLAALQAVEKDLTAEGAQKVYCLGDIVGYGAEPRECIEFVRTRGWPTVIGNHEAAVLKPQMLDEFNPFAKGTLYYTMGAIGKSERDWFRSLPQSMIEPEFQIVHASTTGKDLYINYILTKEDAQAAFAAASRPWVFHGHSHRHLAFFKTDPISYSQENLWKLDPKTPALMNVGSVGQPRDKDPRACYALHDSDKAEVHIRRVEYDVEKAAAGIIAAGLPDKMAERLKTGI